MSPGLGAGAILITGSSAGANIIASTTVQVALSTEELVQLGKHVSAALVEHKVFSPSPQAEFSEEKKTVAHRAIESADAIDKANAAIVLGRPREARAALEQAQALRAEMFRHDTTMADSFYFEGRFDEAVIWFERAFQMPGHDRDVMAICNLALALQRSRLGNVNAAVLRAISLHTEALALVPADSPDWAIMQNNLGTAWSTLPTGDRGANLRTAIACYGATLTVFTREVHAVAWAMTQNNLGSAWRRSANR